MMLRPSKEHYEKMVELVQSGKEWKSGRGWGGKMGWFYGGQTVQGVVPYYFDYKVPRGRRLVVDICIYNNMMESDRCRYFPREKQAFLHFTVCQKPWRCQHGMAEWSACLSLDSPYTRCCCTNPYLQFRPFHIFHVGLCRPWLAQVHVDA